MRLMRDLVGDTLSGRYRMVSRIAGGGMGEVYRAHDMLLDRPVAVKVLQPSLATDPALVERFRAEARAAARLSHPNIVGVYDWGSEDDQTYYMVMEYVSGTDLRDVLVGRGTLQPAQAVAIMAAVCDALELAHLRGLVHRDIKPENILLARDGVVKVADFGIAAVADAERTQPGGNIPGTLRYLSPEQAQGNKASFASDIWSAGSVLGELLTGLPPNQGAGAELLQRRATEPLPLPSVWDPQIPKDLDRVVERACALDPEDRYANAGEMAADLRRVAVRCLPEAPPLEDLLDQVTGDIRLPDMDETMFMQTPRPRRRWRKSAGRSLLVLLVLALLTAGAIGGISYVMPDVMEVPDLTSLSLAEADNRAEASKLEVLVVDKMRTLDVPKGAIVSQEPDAAAELEEGSTIEVVVSAGPPLVRLPRLEGLPLTRVETRMSALGLEVGDITRRHSLDDEGTVLRQSVDPGRVEMRTAIDLVVSKGPRPVEIPEVAGMKEPVAIATLEQAGLSAVVAKAYSDDVPEGRVIGTDPGQGVIVDEASDVTLIISMGPEFERFKMPDVRNMDVDAAKARLESMGLVVIVERSCPGGKTVVETDPMPGETVKETEKVALFVC